MLKGFQHPTKNEYVQLDSDLPIGFQEILDKWAKYTGISDEQAIIQDEVLNIFDSRDKNYFFILLLPDIAPMTNLIEGLIMNEFTT